MLTAVAYPINVYPLTALGAVALSVVPVVPLASTVVYFVVPTVGVAVN